jgi:beta-lactamase superfamily II metal-dependent hydrolase
MMKIDIFDVGHGGCSIITCPNGARVMVDCGLRLDPCWFPSITYFGEQFDLVVFGNLDEDHVEDLPHLWRNVRIRAIFSNPTVTAAALATMKRQHGMAEGVRHAHAILTEYGGGLIGQPPDLGNVEVCAYYNRFGVDFTDTNNLSLAFFVRYGAFTILFAGDLEKAGWRALLRLPAFARELASVNVFVASHHGRDNGCCAEIFQMCRPNVFVISDDEHQYESQDTTDWYRERAHGIPDFRVQPHPIIGYPHRYVLTTRRDGTLSMGVTLDGSFLITPENPPLCGSGFRPALERRRALPIDSW